MNLLSWCSGTVELAQPESNGAARHLADKALELEAAFGMNDSFRDKHLQAILILYLVCPHVRLT